jgi:CheY-like chemotaxis protein
VLVVDDDVDSAETLAELLRVDNHDVRTVHSGVEALRAVEELTPDVVFLDIGLPGLDGYEVARRLGELPARPQILLVALTGYGRPADRERTAQAGFDVHILKPLDPDALGQLVKRGKSKL